MTLAVADTTCLIALDRVGQLDLLPALFSTIAPPAVVAVFRTGAASARSCSTRRLGVRRARS